MKNLLILAFVVIFALAASAGANAQTQTDCTFTLSGSSVSFPYSGGTDSITVTADKPDCVYVAYTDSPFLTLLDGTSQAGGGVVKFAIAGNTGVLARSGVIFISGISFTVYQPSSRRKKLLLSPTP